MKKQHKEKREQRRLETVTENGYQGTGHPKTDKVTGLIPYIPTGIGVIMPYLESERDYHARQMRKLEKLLSDEQ